MKEISKARFGEFLEEVKEEYSAEDYPRLYVEYVESGDKNVIIAVGGDSEVAETTAEFLEKNPEFMYKSQRTKLELLRIPETGFLLRSNI